MGKLKGNLYIYKESDYTVIHNIKSGATTIDFDDPNQSNVNFSPTHKASENAKKEYKKFLKEKGTEKKEEAKKDAKKKEVVANEPPKKETDDKKAAEKKKDGQNNGETPESKKNKPKKSIKQKFKEWKESPTGAAVTPLLGLMGLDIALQSSRYFFSPTIRETKRQLAILEEKRKKGTLAL